MKKRCSCRELAKRVADMRVTSSELPDDRQLGMPKGTARRLEEERRLKSAATGYPLKHG